MATVTVYEFELFDVNRHRWVRDPRLGTLHAIHGVGGIPQQSSAMVVDDSRVDGHGFLRLRERPAQPAPSIGN